MAHLLLDIGNTRIKSAWFDQKLSKMRIYSDINDLIHQVGIKKPQDIWISSVRNQQKNQIFIDQCIQYWQIEPHFLSTQPHQLGVTNGYFDYRKLGVDRWLAILAAWQIYQTAFLVVDCGSAVTLDVVNAQGIHQGGLILPGLSLMQQSLLKQTDLNFNQQPIFNELAQKTEIGIYSGCIQAIIGIIERVNRLNPIHKMILCGGDAETVGHLLDVPHLIKPDLVLQGIQFIIEEKK